MVGQVNHWWAADGSNCLRVTGWLCAVKKWFFVGLLFGSYVLADTFGGAVEGFVFPVVVDVEISETEQLEGGMTRIWGSFYKARECDFEDLAFFLGTPGTDARVSLEFEEGSRLRENGQFDYGPWLVQMTPGQLRAGSYSVVRHRCHPLWLTETRFH